jgi:hypothetical protein
MLLIGSLKNRRLKVRGGGSATGAVSNLQMLDVRAPNVPVLSTPVITTTSITITWPAVTDTGGSGLAGYKLERSPNGSTGWAEIYVGGSNAYVDTPLSSGVTYFYRARSYDNAGNHSIYGSTVSATTAAGSGNFSYAPNFSGPSLIASGDTITITSATNAFGTKPNGGPPLFWFPLQGALTPDPISRGVQGAMAWDNGATSGLVTSVKPLGYSHSFRTDMRGGSGGGSQIIINDLLYFGNKFGDGTQAQPDMYLWCKKFYDIPMPFPSANSELNNKYYRLWTCQSGGYGGSGSHTAFPSMAGNGIGNTLVNIEIPGGDAYDDGGSRRPHPPRGQEWLTEEMDLKQSSAPDVRDGVWDWWRNARLAVPRNVYTNWITRTAAFPKKFGAIALDQRSNPVGSVYPTPLYFYIAGLYLDDSRCRILISDETTYNADVSNPDGTEYIREIQIPVTWSAGSIQLKVRAGEHASLAGKTMYVVKSDGAVLTIGTFAAAGAELVPESGFQSSGVLEDGQIFTITKPAGGFGVKPNGAKPYHWFDFSVSKDPDPNYSRVLTPDATIGGSIVSAAAAGLSNAGQANVLRYDLRTDDFGHIILASANGVGIRIGASVSAGMVAQMKRAYNFDYSGKSSALNLKQMRFRGYNDDGAYIGSDFLSAPGNGDPRVSNTGETYYPGTFGQPGYPANSIPRHGIGPGMANVIRNEEYECVNAGAGQDQYHHTKDGILAMPYSYRWTFTNAGMASMAMDQVTWNPGGSQTDHPSYPNPLHVSYLWWYLDDSRCRVVISDEPDFVRTDQGTSTHDREPQLITSWSDTSISFKLRKGQHATFVGKTAYIIKSDGSALKAGVIANQTGSASFQPTANFFASGAFGNGGTFAVTKFSGGFGLGPNVIVFDPVRGGTPGAPVPLTSPTHGAWSSIGNSGQSPVYNAGGKDGSTCVSFASQIPGAQTYLRQFEKFGLPDFYECFYFWSQYADFPAAINFKQIWTSLDGKIGSPAYHDFYPGTINGIFGNCGTTLYGHYAGAYPPYAMPPNQWIDQSIWMKSRVIPPNNTTFPGNAGDAWMDVYTDAEHYEEVFSDDPYTPTVGDFRIWHETDNPPRTAWNHIYVPGFYRNDGDEAAGFNLRYDDIYLAIGPRSAARFVLTDAPSLAASRRAYICPHTVWADGTVTFTLPTTEWANFIGKTLWWYDENNVPTKVGTGV